MDSGQEKHVIKILSQAGDGEDEPTLTNSQDMVKIMQDNSPAGHAASLESLMQEQAADTTAVTVDEVTHYHSSQHQPTPVTIHMQDQQAPLPPHLLPAQPTQLTPLQLVYLQPTPHGVNIIPIQASGQPSFTPYSPLGFPAHPHHPVVVQPGLPFPHPTFYPSHPVYPQYTPAQPPYQGLVLRHLVSAPVLTPPYRQQFFRPWEDAVHPHTSDQSVLCPHTDCGGEGGQHSQAGPQVPPYSEEDFPELTKELSKIKIKK